LVPQNYATCAQPSPWRLVLGCTPCCSFEDPTSKTSSVTASTMKFLSLLCCIKLGEVVSVPDEESDPGPALNVAPAQLPFPRISLTRPSSPRRQPTSRLLLLPAELRDKIWREVVAGMTFHLMVQTMPTLHRTLQLRSCLCRLPAFPELCRGSSTCWNYWEWSQDDSEPIANIPKLQLLSLLLVCHQT
jgi:hypothetical protein